MFKLGHFVKRIENILQVLNVVLGKEGEISWTDRVRNDEVWHRVKEDKNILHTIKGMKAEWNGHMLRGNWLRKHVAEDRIEGTRRRGIRGRQKPEYLKLKMWYWNFKEETSECTLERTRFGRGYGRVARKRLRNEWMNGFDDCATVHHWYNNINSHLDATVIILLIISISSTCFER